MKVLFVNKFLHPNGGSETYIFELGKQLERMGHEVQYFGMDHENRCVGNQIDCYSKNMDFHTGAIEKIFYPFRIIYSLEAKRKIMSVLENFQPDVIHINNINFQLTPSIIDAVNAYNKKNKCTKKLVATAHDYQWVCPNHMLMIPEGKKLCFACQGGKYYNCSKNKCIHNSKVKSVLGSIEAYFYKIRKTYQQIDTIICPSDFLKQKMDTREELQNKTVVLHNFIPNKSSAGEKQQGDVFQKYDIPEKYLVYFGRYAEEKGVKTLLEVCRLLPDITFVFAGTGPLADEVNRVPNIINIGFQEGHSLEEVVRRAYFCVFPSEWYENCPFSVMEAQAYGTPVLASSLGGTPELIEENATGELFATGQKHILADKIKKLWTDNERIAAYRENCNKKRFLTVEEYCEELIDRYYH